MVSPRGRAATHPKTRFVTFPKSLKKQIRGKRRAFRPIVQPSVATGSLKPVTGAALAARAAPLLSGPASSLIWRKSSTETLGSFFPSSMRSKELPRTTALLLATTASEAFRGTALGQVIIWRRGLDRRMKRNSSRSSPQPGLRRQNPHHSHRLLSAQRVRQWPNQPHEHSFQSGWMRQTSQMWRFSTQQSELIKASKYKYFSEQVYQLTLLPLRAETRSTF